MVGAFEVRSEEKVITQSYPGLLLSHCDCCTVSVCVLCGGNSNTTYDAQLYTSDPLRTVHLTLGMCWIISVKGGKTNPNKITPTFGLKNLS